MRCGTNVEYIKHNRLCPVCFKATRGFGYSAKIAKKPGRGHTFFCSREHVEMSDHHLEQEEDAPLWEAIKKAGAYLDSINQHDLRVLKKEQLMMFGSIIISQFACERAEYFESRRHRDDKGSLPGGLDDEIPF